jgi:hypothetical protein
MGSSSPRLGEPLADDVIVYRAFAAKSFRERNKRVRVRAFYRTPDHTDGISMAETPADAVAGLAVNYGYCSIQVGAIHSLPYGLKVCRNLDEPGHVLLCGVPFLMESEKDRGDAAEIAGALAKIATIVTCDHWPPKQTTQAPPLPRPPQS